MSLHRRLDGFQRRHKVLGVPVAVVYKFMDDQGIYLAALIAFYGFFSIFPLFLLLTSILGFVLDSDPELADAILETAMAQLPLIGGQIQARELTGSLVAITIGALTALYGAIAVASAVQNATNVAWNVRRNQRPNPFVLRLRSIGLLAILGLFVLGTTILSQVGGALAGLLRLSGSLQFFVLGGSLLISTVLFIAIFRFGPVARVSTRQVLPGAVLAGVLWQLLQAGGATIVQQVINRAGVTEGVFGIVLGLIMWLYIAAMGLVFCVELNVVLARRLYPRALLTPMTDRVDLTVADQLAYTHLVQTQSLKGFQNVDVTFDHDGQNATAQRSRRPHVGERRGRNGARTLR